MRPRATSLSLCSGDLDAVYAQQAVARADARIGRAAVGGDGLHGQSGRRQVPYQTGAVDFRFLRLGGREQRDVDEFAQAVHCQHQCAVPHFVGEQFQPIHIGDRQGVDGHQQVARLDARFVRPVSGPHLPHEQPGAAREVFLFGRGERFDAYPIASQQPTLQRSGVPQQLRDAVNRNRGEALFTRRDDGDQIPVEVEQPAARHLAGPGDVCEHLVDRPRPAAHRRRPEVVRRREAGLPVAPPQRDGPLAARPLPGHAAAGRRQPGDRRDAQCGNRQVQTGCRYRDAHVAGGRSDGRGIREAGLGTARQDEVRLPDDAAPVEARQAHDVRPLPRPAATLRSDRTRPVGNGERYARRAARSGAIFRLPRQPRPGRASRSGCSSCRSCLRGRRTRPARTARHPSRTGTSPSTAGSIPAGRRW